MYKCTECNDTDVLDVAGPDSICSVCSELRYQGWLRDKEVFDKHEQLACSLIGRIAELKELLTSSAHEYVETTG